MKLICRLAPQSLERPTTATGAASPCICWYFCCASVLPAVLEGEEEVLAVTSQQSCWRATPLSRPDVEVPKPQSQETGSVFRSSVRPGAAEIYFVRSVVIFYGRAPQLRRSTRSQITPMIYDSVCVVLPGLDSLFVYLCLF